MRSLNDEIQSVFMYSIFNQVHATYTRGLVATLKKVCNSTSLHAIHWRECASHTHKR